MVVEEKLLETIGKPIKIIPLVEIIVGDPIVEEDENLRGDDEDVQHVTYVTNKGTWHLSVLKRHRIKLIGTKT